MVKCRYMEHMGYCIYLGTVGEQNPSDPSDNIFLSMVLRDSPLYDWWWLPVASMFFTTFWGTVTLRNEKIDPIFSTCAHVSLFCWKPPTGRNMFKGQASFLKPTTDNAIIYVHFFLLRIHLDSTSIIKRKYNPTKTLDIQTHPEVSIFGPRKCQKTY